MDGGERVRNAHLQMSAFFFDLIRRDFHIAQVVQRVEDPDNVNAVAHGVLDELAHNVVSVMAVSHQILTSQKHLQLRFFDVFTNDSQPLPGIFVQ